MTATATRFRVAVLLALLPVGLPQTTALAAPVEERFTPAPLPSAAPPRLTPRAAIAIAPMSAPTPQIAAPLSPIRVPGSPPKPMAPAKAAPVAEKATPTAPTAPPPPPPPPPERIPDPPPLAKAVADPPPTETPPTVAPPASSTVATAPATAPEPAPVLAPAPAMDNQAAAAPTAAPQRVVTTAGVYVRATPSGKGRVLDALDPGERLDVIDRSDDGWVRVGRKGKSLGYISAAHLADLPPTNTGGTSRAAPVAPPPGSYAKAAPGDRGCALPDDAPPAKARPALPVGSSARATAAANLRVAPACDAKVVDVLDSGDRVTIQEVVGPWYRIARRNRSPGYVGAALLAPVADR